MRLARVGGWLPFLSLSLSLALTRRHILPGAAAVPAEGPEQRGEGEDVLPADQRGEQEKARGLKRGSQAEEEEVKGSVYGVRMTVASCAVASS